MALFIYLIIFSTEYCKAENYIVKNVEIIEPYSVNFKKNKIIDKAFKSAFNVLIAKIVISDDLNEVKNVNTLLIKSMVDSFTITDEQPENYQLDQGKKVLNESHIKNSATTNMILGLEKGSLQSHETNSQVPRSNVVHGKNSNLQYGRILQQDKLKLYSANDAQGGIFNNFFDLCHHRPFIEPQCMIMIFYSAWH